LRRGGHDPQKVYAAYAAAVKHKGQPTVLLIKTVKGFGMGKIGEGKNNVHQTKKLADEDIKAFRDRFNIPIPDSQLADIPFYKPAEDTPEMRYLHERRKALGGYLPHRRVKADEQFTVPPLETFKSVSAAQLRLAPLALKARVTEPEATKGVAPKAMGALTPGVVCTVAGSTRLAIALPPRVWVPEACKASVVAAAAPLGAAARASVMPSAPAGPL
jgi:transketolase